MNDFDHSDWTIYQISHVKPHHKYQVYNLLNYQIRILVCLYLLYFSLDFFRFPFYTFVGIAVIKDEDNYLYIYCSIFTCSSVDINPTLPSESCEFYQIVAFVIAKNSGIISS